MPENDTESADEKLLILPLGDESKQITKVISNDTAREIIDLLADAPLSASDIAERMNTPLTTVIYNLENLENVGLVKVEKVKYSEKGRKVKIYAPVKKVIVVMPGNTDRESVLNILRKYVGVVLAAVLASSVIEFFTKDYGMRAFSMDMSTAENAPSIMSSQAPVALEEEMVVADEMVEESVGLVESFDVSEGASPEIAMAKNVTLEPEVVSVPVEPIERASEALPAAEPSLVLAETIDTPTLTHPEPSILTNIADTILAHPGLVFLLGCLFVIGTLVMLDYIKKRNIR